MGIDYKDFMHGAALVAIADSSRFTALNKASLKYGHYVVNHDRHVFIKYSHGSGAHDYSFTFTASDKARLRGAVRKGKVYATLVCGEEVITAVTSAELADLIDLAMAASETIKVRAEPGRQLRLRGPYGELGPLPRNSFPERILR